MMDKLFIRKIFYNSLILIIVGLVIFGALIKLNHYWLIGWITGVFANVSGYLINVFLINKFFQHRKTKGRAIWYGLLRVVDNFLYQVLIFVIVVIINKYVNNYSINVRNIAIMYGPINLFTYLGGLSVISFAIIFAPAWKIKHKPKKGVEIGKV